MIAAFVGNRIIDLSYTAAAKLDMLRNGTPWSMCAPSIRRHPAGNLSVDGAAAARAPNAGPGAAVPAAAAQPNSAVPGAAARLPRAPRPSPAALFVQAGVLRPGECATPGGKFRGGTFGKIFVRDDRIAGRRMYRVRIAR